MRSINIDFQPWIEQGLLDVHSSRPTLMGHEQHLVLMHDLVRAFRPTVVAVDPISNLFMAHADAEVKPTLMRLIDWLKKDQITAILTSLTNGGDVTSELEDSQASVSSLMDTWLLLRNTELGGERNRTIFVRKSRGMAHSNQVREFILSDSGIDLVDVYVGNDRVLTGSARVAQKAHAQAAATLRAQDHQRKLRRLAGKRKAIEAQIDALQAEVESDIAELDFAVAEQTLQDEIGHQDTNAMFQRRGGRPTANGKALQTR